jgi:membrane protein implicated in regulation of membrane protease activity
MYHIWLIIPIANLILVSFILLAILCIILMGSTKALNTEESTVDYLMLVMVASFALVVAPVIELSVLLIPIYNNILREIDKNRDESSDYEDYV